MPSALRFFIISIVAAFFQHFFKILTIKYLYLKENGLPENEQLILSF